MQNQFERRIQRGNLTFRAAANADSPGKIEGYAAVFNSRSEDLGGFVELMLPGCFDNVLKTKPDVKCLMNHDSNIVLGRTTNKTLQIRSDSHGLWYSCVLPNTSAGRDIHTLIKRGDISQCSFAFALEPGDDSFTDEKDSIGAPRALRTIRNVSHLFDCSPVTTPAYSATEVSALTAAQMSSMPKISDRALAECRKLGISTYAPKPPQPLVDDEDWHWILKESARKWGQIIAKDK